MDPKLGKAYSFLILLDLNKGLVWYSGHEHCLMVEWSAI